MTETNKEAKAAEKAALAEAKAVEKAALAEAKAAEKAALAEAKAAEKAEVTRVVFTRKDSSTREFTPELHGEDFVKIADEFGETNKNTIATREDL